MPKTQTMVAPNILVVDDDIEIRELLARYLADQGFRISVAAGRRECIASLDERRPDIVVLDIMLPDGSGLDICRHLRAQHPGVPVVLLTALKEDVDRIIGLEIGADDYIGKPFNPRELVARLRAILRRSNATPVQDEPKKVFAFGDLTADPESRKVMRRDEEIVLTGAEFELLHVFLQRPGRLLSRDFLLDITQRRDRDPLDRSIDVLMSRIRKKLETDDTPLFKTVRNHGYQLIVDVLTISGQK